MARGPKPVLPCKIPGCPTVSHKRVKGYCEPHYRRVLEGRPLDAPLRLAPWKGQPRDPEAAPMRRATTGRKRGVGVSAGEAAQRDRDRKHVADLPDDRPEIAQHVTDSFPVWAERFLRIKNTDGLFVPFVCSPIQLRLDAMWEEDMRTRGSVRWIVLKPRKVWVSSYVQGKYVRQIVESPGRGGAVLAHEDTSCQDIFERTRDFIEYLPDGFKRTLKNSNRKEIRYANPHKSFLRVNVVKGRGKFGCGADVHIVHFSEAAYYKNVQGEKRSDSQITALMGSIPRVKGTAVILESTANGEGGEFHNLWNGAKKGTNGLRPIFFSWMDFPEYRLPGQKPSDHPTEPDWEAEEPTLRALGADDEQLAWRRLQIRENCTGDLDTFHQFFPATPEEAFVAEGGEVFPGVKIAARRAFLNHSADPVAAAERGVKFNPALVQRYSFDADGKPRPKVNGELRIFRPPAEFPDTNRLVITADPAGTGKGAPKKGDPCCAYVWDRENNEQVAEWHGYASAVEFGRALNHLGRYYGNPLAIVEAGPYGGHAVSTLSDLGYPRVYHREDHGNDLQFTPTDYGKLGWRTDASTRPRMLKALEQFWIDDQIRVNSAECCTEHLTLTSKDGKIEAQKGCHDDRMIVCAIYAKWSLDHPYAKPRAEKPPPKPWGASILDDVLGETDRAGRKVKRL